MKTFARKLLPLSWALPVLLASMPAFAAADRASHPIGAYAGIQSGSVESVNVGFNVNDQWRVHGGDLVTMSNGFKSYNVYEAGLIYMTSQSGLSPFLGGELEGIGLNSANGKPSGISSSVAGEAGVDWTAHNGFNLGMRGVLPLSDLTNIRFMAYLGWYL
jgi:hypothetical protein